MNEKAHLFRRLDGNKVVVDLLRFGGQLLRLGVLVLFAREPKLEVLVAELAEQERPVQRGTILKNRKKKKTPKLNDRASFSKLYFACAKDSAERFANVKPKAKRRPERLAAPSGSRT